MESCRILSHKFTWRLPDTLDAILNVSSNNQNYIRQQLYQLAAAKLTIDQRSLKRERSKAAYKFAKYTNFSPLSCAHGRNN